MRHTKYAPNRFIEEARPALESFANGSEMKLIAGWIVQALRNINKADALAAIKKQVIALTDQFPLP